MNKTVENTKLDFHILEQGRANTALWLIIVC